MKQPDNGMESIMGDRALILFTDGKEVSPTVYLHWSGSRVPELLDELKILMSDRLGDVGYSAARFIGLCHATIDGSLSLGCWNAESSIEDAVWAFSSTEADSEPALTAVTELKSYSHGDAGVVIVNVNDLSWKAVGGYLARYEVAA